ncbi:MAG: hypothetical protein AB1813_19705 [Verrucomicrobiota bacterium]
MSTSLALTIFAVVCVVAAACLARRHLCARRGLRRVFMGLFLAAIAGVAVAQSSTLVAARVLSLPMLAGVGLVIWGVCLEKTRGHDAA